MSGLLRDSAHVRQSRSRGSRCCPGVTVMTLGLPPDRARGGHDPLIRRLRQVVQDRLLRSVCWADIPGLSVRDRRCPVAWQQYWQQSLVLATVAALAVSVPTVRFSEGFPRPHKSTTVRLSRPEDVSGHLGVHGRPHVSTAVVSTALAVGLFVPRGEASGRRLGMARHGSAGLGRATGRQRARLQCTLPGL